MSSEAGTPTVLTTRHRILQAAWQVIEARGSGLRLLDVADRAGVSRQAVYLHFGDRTGLLVALVEHVDESLSLDKLLDHAFEAPTGIETLERMVKLHGTYTTKIDAVTRVLEAAQYEDEALGKAWRNRMDIRRSIYQAIVERIAAERGLADGWTVDAAADLCYTLTMPGPWRELTRELGWTAEQYTEHLTRFIKGGILDS
jgi:AcrR family transcriptional regulator